MQQPITLLLFLLTITLWFGCDDNQQESPKDTYIDYFYVNGELLQNKKTVNNIAIDNIVIDIVFSNPVNIEQLEHASLFFSNLNPANYTITLYDSKQLRLTINKPLTHYTVYKIYITQGHHLGVNIVDSYEFGFMTVLDEIPKFPIITDDDLLTLVQRQTFKYFYEYAHPVAGLARERLGSSNTITTGGSGFGIAAIPVAIEREFVTRQQGYEHLLKIVNFLTTADRYHGVWGHWINGETGKTQPFSTNDNGADLIETSFLIEGLLVAREYFKTGNTEEQALCNRIQTLYEEVEWTHFLNGKDALYWHWSPDKGFIMNMTISGWNEGLITYVLAAASPTYPITKELYDKGWARNGGMRNGRKFYDITLPLGYDYGGPLFFAHYSFIGLDPRKLNDEYADYWEQNVAHAKINYNYCVQNPKKYFGYGDRCWGLTASDVNTGYTASSPTNDVGCIAPTAALASFPYTPQESMKGLHFFYYTIGDKLWGDYGFKDAFSLSHRWFASSYLAIDQGPIITMIENYRTGLCWNLFMQNQDIQRGLERLMMNYE